MDSITPTVYVSAGSAAASERDEGTSAKLAGWGCPDAAVTVVNDPIGDAGRIRSLVEAGFIVRTRADADTVQARSGDTTQRDAALASGAQYVSTDYVWTDDRFGTGYVVDLPGDTAARCNPVSAPRRCERAFMAVTRFGRLGPALLGGNQGRFRLHKRLGRLGR